MKKLLLGASMLALSVGANAQLANGSQAPDFTITDIDGNTHTLSDYMAAGKTVIMDISATWCGPCWSFHQTHALEEIYQAYGPGGSDEVVVLFVEGDDQNTGLSELQGSGNTQGNWLEGTSYPVIDNGGSIANDYQIQGYPTLFSICPDGNGGGTTYDFVFSSEFNRPDILAKINECNAVTGIANNAKVKGSTQVLCNDGETVDFDVEINNYGTSTLTSATVSLKENGSEVSSQSFSGSVASFEEGSVSFSNITLNSSSTYTVDVVDVNGGANGTVSVANIEVEAAPAVNNAIVIDIITDYWPEETSWRITDDAGTLIAGSENPTLEDTTQYVQTIVLDNTGCYIFEINDSYGDGILNGNLQAGPANGAVEIRDYEGTVIYSGANFGSQKKAKFNVNAITQTASVEETTIENVAVYPNPATDVLNVSFEANNADYTVSLTDLSGRTMATNVFTSLSGAQSIALPVAELANGNYILTISSEEGSYTQKVVIK